MTDALETVFVTGLAVYAHHGVMTHEQTVGQTFLLDILLSLDLARAAASDDLADTVSYDDVVQCAVKAFSSRVFHLIEAAAAAVADAILAAFPKVMHVRVTIHKPHAPIAATFSDVGVTIARARSSRARRG